MNNRLQNLLNWLDKRASRWCVWFTVFTTLTMIGMVVYGYYTFYFHGWVSASVSQALWYVSEGDPSFPTLLQFNYIVSHGAYLMLALVPLYWIWPSALWCSIMKPLFVGLAVIPLYKIARLYLRPSFSLVVVLLFLLGPGIYAQNFDEANRIYEVFLILFLLYYFLRGNWKAFMLFLVLTMISRLSIMPALMLLPVYALLRRPTGIAGDERRRSLVKWAVVPGLLIVVYALVSILWIMPNAQTGQYVFLSRYQQFGNGFKEVALNVVLQPGKTFSMLTAPANLLYYCALLLPFGFIFIFRSFEWIFAVPILLLNHLQDEYATPSICDQYTPEIVPFLAAAFVITLYKIIAGSQKRSAASPKPASGDTRIAVLLLVLLLAVFAFHAVTGNTRLFDSQVHLEARCRAVELIPSGAGVQGSNNLIPHLSCRKILHPYSQNPQDDCLNEEVEYFLLDMNLHDSPYEALATLQSNPDKYELLYQRDGIYLYRRR